MIATGKYRWAAEEMTSHPCLPTTHLLRTVLLRPPPVSKLSEQMAQCTKDKSLLHREREHSVTGFRLC